MPKTLTQWTGVAITTIVVSGSDFDLLLAAPLGLFAGGLAALFSHLAERAIPAARPSAYDSNARRPALQTTRLPADRIAGARRDHRGSGRSVARAARDAKARAPRSASKA